MTVERALEEAVESFEVIQRKCADLKRIILVIRIPEALKKSFEE